MRLHPVTALHSRKSTSSIFFFFTVLFSQICSEPRCSYCASMFATSNSTNNCTECVVKVQTVSWVVPPERCSEALGGWVWTSKVGGDWKFLTPTCFQAFNRTGINQLQIIPRHKNTKLELTILTAEHQENPQGENILEDFLKGGRGFRAPYCVTLRHLERLC